MSLSVGIFTESSGCGWLNITIYKVINDHEKIHFEESVLFHSVPSVIVFKKKDDKREN